MRKKFKYNTSSFLLFCLLVVSCIIIIGLYIATFGIDLINNKNIYNWVNTATYLNNMLQPILLITSIFLLYKTWQTSKKELSETRTLMKTQTDVLLFEKVKETLPMFIESLQNNNVKDIPSKNKDVNQSIFRSKLSDFSYLIKDPKLINQDDIKAKYGVGVFEHLSAYCSKNYCKEFQAFQFVILSNDERDLIKTIYNKMIAFIYLTDNTFLKSFDRDFINIFEFISSVTDKKLRLLLYKELVKSLGGNLALKGLFIFYQSRYKTLSKVTESEFLKECIRDFYDNNFLETYKLDLYLIELINKSHSSSKKCF
ncbi:hypothetical protein PUND_a0673 [Pseudoalteromonas undina]|uniref:Phage abortive infection protein n=1 Tax=Pseudoalteromonas undina TaxID=43660 RepID=A0ABN0NMY9_9GAMM|nr:hypothetical protein [Pseudoalteromonas undina]KAF7769536.1 hypothetical protein PUND_a0673 [Pseudoalteromonas undina]